MQSACTKTKKDTWYATIVCEFVTHLIDYTIVNFLMLIDYFKKSATRFYLLMNFRSTNEQLRKLVTTEAQFK